MPVLRSLSTAGLVALGVAVAVALVMFVAPFASTHPDGLEKVAADTGIDAAAGDHHLVDGPLADYDVNGVGNQMMSTWVAGVAGIGTTFAVGAGAVWLVRRRGPSAPTNHAGAG